MIHVSCIVETETYKFRHSHNQDTISLVMCVLLIQWRKVYNIKYAWGKTVYSMKHVKYTQDTRWKICRIQHLRHWYNIYVLRKRMYRVGCSSHFNRRNSTSDHCACNVTMRRPVTVIVAVVAAGVARRRWEVPGLLFIRSETLQCYLLKSVGLLDYKSAAALRVQGGRAGSLSSYFVREIVTYGGLRALLNRDVNWGSRYPPLLAVFFFRLFAQPLPKESGDYVNATIAFVSSAPKSSVWPLSPNMHRAPTWYHSY